MHWYALLTRSNYEKRVAEELARTNIETYLPVFRELHQWQDRKKLVEVPVFRGYVFARFDERQSRLSVLRAEGVVRILGTRNASEPVAEREIKALRQLLTKATARCWAHPLLQEGAWVRMKRGALKNLEGLLVRVKNQTRLVVSVTLLSQSVSTEVDASDVEFIRLEKISGRRVA